MPAARIQRQSTVQGVAQSKEAKPRFMCAGSRVYTRPAVHSLRGMPHADSDHCSFDGRHAKSSRFVKPQHITAYAQHGLVPTSSATDHGMQLHQTTLKQYNISAYSLANVVRTNRQRTHKIVFGSIPLSCSPKVGILKLHKTSEHDRRYRSVRPSGKHDLCRGPCYRKPRMEPPPERPVSIGLARSVWHTMWPARHDSDLLGAKL